LNFVTKFEFCFKIWILQNLNFVSKFEFCYEIWILLRNLNFVTKFEFVSKFELCFKIWILLRHYWIQLQCLDVHQILSMSIKFRKMWHTDKFYLIYWYGFRRDLIWIGSVAILPAHREADLSLRRLVITNTLTIFRPTLHTVNKNIKNRDKKTCADSSFQPVSNQAVECAVNQFQHWYQW